jgi:hypothetical protein
VPRIILRIFDVKATALHGIDVSVSTTANQYFCIVAHTRLMDAINNGKATHPCKNPVARDGLSHAGGLYPVETDTVCWQDPRCQFDDGSSSRIKTRVALKTT